MGQNRRYDQRNRVNKIEKILDIRRDNIRGSSEDILIKRRDSNYL